MSSDIPPDHWAEHAPHHRRKAAEYFHREVAHILRAANIHNPRATSRGLEFELDDERSFTMAVETIIADLVAAKRSLYFTLVVEGLLISPLVEMA